MERLVGSRSPEFREADSVTTLGSVAMRRDVIKTFPATPEDTSPEGIAAYLADSAAEHMRVPGFDGLLQLKVCLPKSMRPFNAGTVAELIKQAIDAKGYAFIEFRQVTEVDGHQYVQFARRK